MNRLRIAMVGLRGLPATFGGIERHVEELGSRLVERGHEVVVFCRPGYAEEQLDTYRGMRLVPVRTVDEKHLEAFVHSGLSTLRALGMRPDVVHFHALGPGLFSPLPRYLSRSAVVQTVHGLDDRRAKWGGGAQKVLALGGWLSGRVPHETVTVSRTLAAEYADLHGRACTYVPNGAPYAMLRPPQEITERWGLRGDDYVLWVGRVVPEKAPDLLVRAFREVRTDKRLVVVGGSSHSDGYSEQVRALAAADPRVLLTGYVYGDALAELYSNASLYVQPSLLEGLPLTLLEAAAYRRPVVVSDIGAHAEVVPAEAAGSHGTRVVPTGDAAALTEAVQGALDAPEETRLGGDLLHEHVAKHYDWEAVADETVEVYERALATRRRRRR